MALVNIRQDKKKPIRMLNERFNKVTLNIRGLNPNCCLTPLDHDLMTNGKPCPTDQVLLANNPK